MPFNTFGNEWTPEYAAQVLAIAQQAQAANPDVPMMNQPGIVPMGSPGSLDAPVMAPAMEAPQMAPSMSEAGPEAPGPSPTSIGGGGWQDKLQQMLPLIAAMGYGMDPRTRHMVPIAMQMGKMQQEQGGQRQLAEVRANIAKLGEKGPDAVKKYLTETVANPNLSPDASKVVADQLGKLTERTNERDAVAKLTSRDAKDIMAVMPDLVESMGAERAMAIYKGLKLDEKGQFLQAGDQIFWGDRATQEIKEVARATPKFNAASIGGTDITQELTRMGVEDASQATAEQKQQAAQNLLNRSQEEKEKGRRTQLTAADIAAKGAVAGAVKTEQLRAEREHGMMEKTAAKELAGIKTTHEQFTEIYKAFDPSYQGPLRGRWGGVSTAAGWASPEEVEQRTKTVAAMNKKLREDSGLAVTDPELQRKLAELPQAIDPPEVFRTKTRLAIEDAARDYGNRYQYYNSPRSGLPPQLESPSFGGKKTPKGRRVE